MTDNTLPTDDSGVDGGEDESAVTVKRGTLLILVMIAVSILWYLLSDRFTPYTTQARVQGYVVGVAPKVGGLVTEVLVKNNQEVQANQLVFKIDPSQYQIALDRAESDLESAQRQVDAGDAGVDAARANLQAAKANETKARQDLQRLTRLHQQDSGTVSVRRIEISQATLEQAQARVIAARADINRAIEQMGGSDSNNNAILKSAQSAVAKAELDLSNTQVKVGARGVITNLTADVGQYANAGQPVMTLVAVHDVWINAEFTENNLGHMVVGSPVEILFDALPGEIFQGNVRSIGLGISAGSAQQPGTLPSIDNSRDWLRQSQRFPVIVHFDTQQQPQLSSQLRIGGQASVIAYTEGHGFLGFLGKVYIRVVSWLAYAY